MYSSKDAANSSYPTQWALNPTAYQNVDSNSVDWAALAQQWIAMKDAAAVLAAPPAPPSKEIEEGEAPMEVENIDNNEASMPADWNSSSNSWSSGWNQWGWGWGGNGQMDPKMADPSMTGMAPLMDGFIPPEGTAQMPGYTSGTAAPTFQHGYWTAPQTDQGSQPRSSSRNRDSRRSKSKNRDHKEKPSAPLPVAAPVVAPATTMSTMDAAKRRQLPAWIREGLEKMEREKQRAIEREQELKAQEEAEKEKKRLEEEELLRMKAEASGDPIIPPKSKFIFV
ncbi:hypothetical protein OBRU01_17343 [Operophtera brumata]|uniref:Arginine/serine-rich protein PNISR n=1 Tax=Operophtera brumata TaxID=104452 RepID=A0A0L7KYB8_OPEBR|nr:hypothetical protein OBRU01_17343 [Operophtera brumata]